MCPNVFVSSLEKRRCLATDLSRMDKEKYIVRNQAINWLSKWVSAMYLRLIFHCVLSLFLFTEGLKEIREVSVLENSSWEVPIWVLLTLPIAAMRSVCSGRVRLVSLKQNLKTRVLYSLGYKEMAKVIHFNESCSHLFCCYYFIV